MAEQKPLSLFAQRPRRRARMIVMVVGSFAVHGAILGLAALKPTPTSVDAPILPTDVDLVEAEPPGPIQTAPLERPVSAPEPTPSMPEATQTPDEAPPEPEMALPDTTLAPPPKPRLKATSTVYPKEAKRSPVLPVGVPNGVSHAEKTSGGLGGNSGVGKWVTPKPPYPYQARASRVQGNGSVRVSTNASGEVISAVLAQSTGNGILDSATVSFARTKWHGPPNATATIPITYRLNN